MDIKFWDKLNNAERVAALTRPAQNDSAKVAEIARSIIHELLESMKDPGHREFISIPCRLVIRESI